MKLPELDDIHRAAAKIKPYAHRTPVLTSKSLDEKCGAELFFKCENFQKGGAFKFRGGVNTVFSLSETDASKGVATHSSGNHAQAIALSAKLRGVPAYIVMPENAPKVKVAAVRGYGADITFCESTLKGREATLEEVVEATGASFIHPYNDPLIVAGQGTAALELLEDHPDLNTILAPVGGGGLLSGSAIAASGIDKRIRVIGTEPEAADDAWRSFREGRLILAEKTDTIADGLRTSLGELTFACIQEHVDNIVTVSEQSIADAMRFVWERMNIIIEPSSAVPVAALLDHKLETEGVKIGVILSGGNVDLDNLPW